MFKLKNKFQEIKQENEELKNSDLCSFELSSDKIYNQFIGFSSVNILKSFSIFIDPGQMSKTLYFVKLSLQMKMVIIKSHDSFNIYPCVVKKKL